MVCPHKFVIPNALQGRRNLSLVSLLTYKLAIDLSVSPKRSG